jgi:hypothetical protein
MNINTINHAELVNTANVSMQGDEEIGVESWVVALAMAIRVLVDLNFFAQITTSNEMFSFMNAYFPKSAAYSKALAAEAIAVFEAKLAVNGEHPERAAAAAAEDAKYSALSQEMNKELDKLNSLIQTAKTRVKQENDANDNLFSMEEPFAQVLKMLVGIIKGYTFK